MQDLHAEMPAIYCHRVGVGSLFVYIYSNSTVYTVYVLLDSVWMDVQSIVATRYHQSLVIAVESSTGFECF